MKEKIINIKKSTSKGKKYTAVVENIKTKKTRVIHFGGSDYEQFRDSTKLGYYTKKNHGSLKKKNKTIFFDIRERKQKEMQLLKN